MNSSFMLSQLRAALLALIAFLAGKGIFTPIDATFATAMVTALGPILAPFIMSAYANFGVKKVPQDSIAVMPTVQPHPDDAPNIGEQSIVAGKIVGTLLFALILFGATPSAFAQQRPLSPLVANIQQTLVADLTAARDDAKANADPSEACWAMLLDHASNMPPKILGVAHTAQRLRDIRRGLPKVMETCAVVKDGAREAIIQIFAVGASGASALAFFGL